MEMKMFCFLARNEMESTKNGSIRRMWSKFDVVTKYLSESEFAIQMLPGRMQPHFIRNEATESLSSGGAVQPEERLAIMLRMLAGGSYIDQMMTWSVGRSMTFRVFLDTVRANKEHYVLRYAR